MFFLLVKNLKLYLYLNLFEYAMYCRVSVYYRCHFGRILVSYWSDFVLQYLINHTFVAQPTLLHREGAALSYCLLIGSL